MSTTDYAAFLAAKTRAIQPAGFTPHEDWIPAACKPHQRDVVRWNCRMGRSADFLDTGLGKSLIELVFLHCCRLHTRMPGLLLTPLAVGPQIVREAGRFGVPNVHLAASDADVRPDSIAVTNYQKLHRFTGSRFGAVGGDESSIVKDHTSATRNALLDFLAPVPFRLLATATPAPNDHEELGNHAELLGVCTRAEMLATYFVHDSGDTSKWRLRGHAEAEFWRWVATWAVVMRRPSDLGYPDDGYDLPPLTVHEHWVEGGPAPGRLFAVPEKTLNGRRKARRSTLPERVAKAAELADAALRDGHKVVVWCDLNDEQDAFRRLAGPRCVSIQGSTPDDDRIELERAWREGPVPILATKGSQFGHGMNWQHCSRQIFIGVGDSYERFYQCVRRSWRYGQTRPVDAHVVTSEGEALSWQNVQRKQRDHEAMQAAVLEHTRGANRLALSGGHVRMSDTGYRTDTAAGDGWALHLGDCVERVREIPDDSVHYSLFSPPFSSLYVYSDSPRDMGNCTGDAEFFRHFDFLARELYRVLMPGRLLSFHCWLQPTTIERQGYIGLENLRDDLIRLFKAVGFIHHSEVCVWKDPVTAMQRTKALGLLHAQIKKDSCRSRQGIADYVVTMLKPGKNPEPVAGRFEAYVGQSPPDPTDDPERYSIEVWQRYASPVWTDIDQTRVLPYAGAREAKDDRHICPLQLQVIERCLDLWTNPGDLVLSPFAGVGSEGYVAVKTGRRFVGVELKESYFRQAVKHLTRAEREANQKDLFAHVAGDAE